MEGNVQTSESTIHKYLFTVTIFSKLLAMFFFILFPVIGFYIGYIYGKTTAPAFTQIIDTNNSSSKYISFQQLQSPTGEIVYQTEIPNSWAGYTKYQANDEFGKFYGPGKGIYTTNLGPAHYSIYPNQRITNDMYTPIAISYSNNPSAIGSDSAKNSNKIDVGGITATTSTSQDQGGKSLNIGFTKGNTSFAITEYYDMGSPSAELEHILSTFKVVKGLLY